MNQAKILLCLLLFAVALAGCKQKAKDFVALAKQAETEGNRANAITYYEQAIRVQPGDLTLRESLIRLLIAESREADAIPHLLLLAHNKRDDGVLLVRTVKLLLEFGGWKESKELYDAAPVAVINLPEVRDWHAELLAREGKLDPAIKMLTALIEETQTPTNVVRSAQLRRGRLINQTGKAALALAEFDNVLKKWPDDADAMLLRANLLVAMTKHAEARKAYEELLQKHPKEHEAYIGLASLSVLEKRPDEAIKLYQEAQKLDPKDVNILFWLAELYFEKRDGDSLKGLQAKVQGRKWETEIFQGYLSGLIKMLANQQAEALKEFERLQPLLTTYPGLYDKIGLCHLKLGNPVQAEVAFAKIAHDDAVQQQVWGALGRGFLAATNYPRAVRWLEISRSADRLGPLAQAQFGLGDLPAAYKNALLWLKDEPTSETARLIAAEASRRLELDGEGKNHFEQLAAASPNSPAGIYARAQLLVTSNRLEEAAVLLQEKASELEKQSGPTLLQGEIYLRLGKLDEAEKYLQRTLVLEPKYARAHSLLGLLAQNRQDPAKAEKYFDAALAADPVDRLGLMSKGWMVYEKQDFATSADLFEKASNLRHADPDAALLWSLSEFGRGDAKRGLQAAEKAVQLSPTNTFARYLEVRGNIATLQWKRAIPKALELNRQQPAYGAGYHALALIALSTNDVTQALSYIQTGLQKQPKSQLLQPLEIELLRAAKKLDQAQARLEVFRRDFPNDPELFLAEVNLAFERQDYAGAREICFKGLALNPMDRRLQQRVLDSYVQAGQEKDAAPVIEDLLKKDPKHTALRFFCARLRELRGDWKEAEAHYRAVLEVEPKNISSLNNLSIVIGRDKAQLEDAIKLAKRAYVLDDKNPLVADTLAGFMLQSGDFRQARILLQAASRQAPKNLDIRLHLVEAYIEEGSLREAKKELQAIEKELPKVSNHSKYQPLVTKLGGTGGVN